MIEYAEWKATASDETAPEFVKKASFADSEPASGSTGILADIVHDELPCNTPAETWMSARAFAKKAETGCYDATKGLKSDIRGRIMKSAAAFGISEQVEKALTVAHETKQASDGDFGWSKGGDRKYPLFDIPGVKKACDYFERNKFMYPFGMRSTIARNILRKAAEFGIPDDEIPDGVRKTAGYGLARPDNVINELMSRAETCTDLDSAEALAGVAEKVAELGMDALSDGAAEKIAELVEDTDVISGLHKSYGRKILAPEDFLFDISLKSAEDMAADVIEIGGDALSLRKLAELPDDLFDGVFGDGFAESCKEAGAIDPQKLGKAISERPEEDVNELATALRSL